MKKAVLFFLFFFVSALLEAEDLPENREEKAENAINGECGCETQPETEEKSKFFYIQPAIGFGTGLSLYRPTVSVAAAFLVGETNKVNLINTKKINYYIGLDIEARIAMIEFEPRELAVQATAVFDFVQRNVPGLKSASFWIAIGADLTFIRARDEEWWQDYFNFYCFQAWGLGVDLLFENSMMLRLAVDGFVGVYPDFTILVGYRF
jgi:hypothetical protein